MDKKEFYELKTTVAVMAAHLKSIDQKLDNTPVCEKEIIKTKVAFLTRLVFWVYFCLFSLSISVILGLEVKGLITQLKELACFTFSRFA